MERLEEVGGFEDRTPPWLLLTQDLDLAMIAELRRDGARVWVLAALHSWLADDEQDAILFGGQIVAPQSNAHREWRKIKH